VSARSSGARGRRPASLAVVLLLLALAALGPRPAHARDTTGTGLSEAIRLERGGDHAGAAAAARALLARGGNEPEVVLELLELLALSSAGGGREREALDVFGALLELRPDHVLGAEAAPTSRALLLLARRERGARPQLGILLEAPSSLRYDAALHVAVRVENDPRGLARAARLLTTLPGAMGEGRVTASLDRRRASLLSVDLALEGAHPGTLLYRIELLDRHGNVLARRGEARSPLSLELRGAPEPELVPGRPWYKRWYFWAAVGVAIVGGTTAAVLGATGKTGTSDVAFGWRSR
jgi:hypothetical protein